MNKKEILSELKGFAIDQLEHVIMPFWRNRMIDDKEGGFYGQINDDLSVEQDAIKGLVLNARILWTFSAVYGKFGKKEDLLLADRAYHYLLGYFFDKQYGGYFWSLSSNGNALEDKKQIYAQAFTIYGLSEYYKITHNEIVLDQAVELFRLIEKNSFDRQYGGYTEACSREWKELDNLQLSPKDMNEKKSQNTHLHVLEAYTNLYAVWPDRFLKTQLENLIHTFTTHILHPADSHLILFFNEKWEPKSSLISFGHDIECSWLLHEAALATQDPELIRDIESRSIAIAGAAKQGYLDIGAMRYEDDRMGIHQDNELEWWAQAEAVVGFLNIYAINPNEADVLTTSYKIMRFIDTYISDRKNGEWYFRVDRNGNPLRNHEKAGFWKCPYHNARACLEILHRVKMLENRITTPG
jgi:mannobiose 2-epimerase